MIEIRVSNNLRIVTLIKIIPFIFIICLFTSCSTLLHNSYKIQSDNRLRKTEDHNFLGEKALTQWWYFDFFLEDGSVLVVLFAPYHWWEDHENEPDLKSLIYLSYMKANGEVISSNKVFESKELHFDENSMKSPYLEIIKSHKKNIREYTINFFMDEIKGSAKITSSLKAFSPLLRGSLGPFGTKHILKQKGKVAYRYAAHVPKGVASCNLEFGNDRLSLSGKAYHEQGWFTGQAHQMGEGWEWFHFSSESINLFGAKSFFYLEMNGELLIGGLNSFNSRCQLSDEVFAKNTSNFILEGELNFTSSKISFEVVPIGTVSTPLIYIPANDTDQLWGTTLQPSRIQINNRGEELSEDGRLIIETCRMSKINLKRVSPIDSEDVTTNRMETDKSE